MQLLKEFFCSKLHHAASLFAGISIFAASLVAVDDGEEVKEDLCVSHTTPGLRCTTERWRDRIHREIGQAQFLPSPLIDLVADYIFPTPMIAAGAHHALFAQDKRLWLWGGNQNGQLGKGTERDHFASFTLPNENFIAQVALGFDHTLILTTEGQLYAWGGNFFGQLGNNSNVGHLPATLIPTNGKILQIAAGSNSSVALMSDGQVLVWGKNRHGELGDGAAQNLTPMPVLLKDKIVEIAANFTHFSARTMTGKIIRWGHYGYTDRFELEEATIKGQPIQMALGEYVTLVLTDKGKVWAWE